MTRFHRVAGFVFFFLLNVVAAFGQTPSVPKLPYVHTGQQTKNGVDYKIPGPKEGYVPDKETAVKIAEVVLFRLVGEKDIAALKPYVVTEDDYIWWVGGTMPKNGLGSAFKIAISKQTAAVLYLEL